MSAHAEPHLFRARPRRRPRRRGGPEGSGVARDDRGGCSDNAVPVRDSRLRHRDALLDRGGTAIDSGKDVRKEIDQWAAVRRGSSLFPLKRVLKGGFPFTTFLLS
jgi:hypothetical protein